MEETEFYLQISREVESGFENYIYQSGFPEETIKNLFTEDMIKKDANSLINFLYDGTEIKLSSEILRTNLEKKIQDYIKSENMTLTEQNIQNIDKFKNLMSQQEEILEKTGVKTSLTERDKKVIDALIDVEFPSIYPDKVKNKVQNVASAMPEIGELLRLDERYSKYLED